MTIKTYTLAEQQQILSEYMKRGAYRTMALTYRKMDALMRLALERAAAPEAYDKYGDTMFHQSLPELERETWEELADAFNRQAVYDAKERGLLP
jgi:hypothetical protein